MVSTSAYLALVAAVALQRLLELWRSRANVRWAMARGGTEVGEGHYPVMVALHALFLSSCAAEVLLGHRPFPGVVGWVALGALAGAQALRLWAIRTLGRRWTTRIVIVPALAPVSAGPYRYLRHPNYLAVVAEIAALPLVHGAWLTALVFTAANAALLRVRIRTEERALGESWRQAFASTPRWVPGGPHG